MSPLTGLLARLREAREGSPNLNREIAEHLGWKLSADVKPWNWVAPDRRCFMDVPNYTGSLDAAMTLAPQGSVWDIYGPYRYLHIPDQKPNFWRAQITIYDPARDHVGWGATEALARCIAALQAREASNRIAALTARQGE